MPSCAGMHNARWKQGKSLAERREFRRFFQGKVLDKKHTYITLLTSGRLNAYLADIDRQAQERMERLTEQMKRTQGITEQLKAENALEWVQRMNNILACAREIVEREIIYT